MSNLKPNIITPFNDKLRFKNLVNEVINDSWIYTLIPDSISNNGLLFTLNLINKKFVFEDVKVDKLEDYIDIYFSNIKVASDYYNVVISENNIIINLVEPIINDISGITNDLFLIKGKIVGL